jgi:RNA polymerase sigma-70 factor (ECF subfamily)
MGSTVGDDAEIADLMRAANAGDARAYATALSAIAGRVRPWLARRCAGRGVDVEDLVQETLLAVHLKRHTWQPDAPVMPWAHAIARHKLADALRRRGASVPVDIDDLAETLPAPTTDPGRAVDLARALGTLADRPRRIVEGIAVEGLSVREVAQRLGANETAVRVALHRALKTLSARFGRS